jgi:hypothetical protein
VTEQRLTSRLFGEWERLETIGDGGNGQVWRVRSAVGGVEAAAKILGRLSRDGYPRFKREVSTLEQLLTTDLSVLPVVDAHLPLRPSKANRPWYVMPLGTKIAEAFAEAAPREIARAVSALARTLVRLANEHAMHHRDIKPDNLFVFQARPVLADFGLVLWAHDGTEGLTHGEAPAAGAWAFAPDDLRQGIEPDWDRFDCHCLAKTLWCLVSKRERPPGGRIHAGGIYSLEKLLVQESFIAELDIVIERATLEDPERRSSLGVFADEIDAWLYAVDLREGIVADERGERFNRDTVQRWLVARARSSASAYGKALLDLGPSSSSPVPGLSLNQFAEAIDGLAARGLVSGEAIVGDGNRTLGWSRLFPRVEAVEQVEARSALEAETAFILRGILDGSLPPAITLGTSRNPFGRDGAEAYFRLWYLRSRGLLEFQPLSESGADSLVLLSIQLTPLAVRRLDVE